MRPSFGVDLERLVDIRLRGIGLAFLNQGARHVQPAVGIAGLGLGHFLEGVLRAFQIALQQQSDAPIVPALPVLFAHDRSPCGRRPSGTLDCGGSHRNDRQIGNAILDLARNIPRNIVRIEAVLQAVETGGEQFRILPRLRLARISELREIVRELAVIQFGRERDGPCGVFRNLHAIMHHVGRARGNQAHVQHAARLPGIALVDHVAVAIDLKGAIEVRARFHRALAAILRLAAPEDHAAVGVLALQFQPYIGGVYGAAREEMADLARAHHHIHARCRARLQVNARVIDRRGYLSDIADHGAAGLFRFLAHREAGHRCAALRRCAAPWRSACPSLEKPRKYPRKSSLT